MKIFIADLNGDLTSYPGKSIVAAFDNGNVLELIESPTPQPPSIPEGLQVWGDRVTSQVTADAIASRLNITPVAGNGIIITPFSDDIPAADGMTIFISDNSGILQPIRDKSIVIELSNGKTLEIREDYTKGGLLTWGGRESIPGLSLEELKGRTENIGIYPMSANVIHIFPFKTE